MCAECPICRESIAADEEKRLISIEWGKWPSRVCDRCWRIALQRPDLFAGAQ